MVLDVHVDDLDYHSVENEAFQDDRQSSVDQFTVSLTKGMTEDVQYLVPI